MNNYSEIFQAFTSINSTSDCDISILWRQSILQKGCVNAEHKTLGAAFIRGALPSSLNLTQPQVSDFYDAICEANPGSWMEEAVVNIETNCLAPRLAQSVAFPDLDSSRNCSASAAFYANMVCAANPKTTVSLPPGHTLSMATQTNVGWGLWPIFSQPPTLESTLGLRMLREAWPYDSSNITDATLRAWIPLAMARLGTISTEGNTPTVCNACLSGLCQALQFAPDTDVDGIGIMVAYSILCGYVLIAYGCKIFLRFRHDNAMLENATKTAHLVLIGVCVALVFCLSMAGLIAIRRTLTSYYEIVMTGHAILLSTLAVISSLLMLSAEDFRKIEAVNRYLLALVLISTTVAVVFSIIRLSKFQPTPYSDEPCLRAGMRTVFNPKAMSYAPLVLVLLAIVIITWTFLIPDAKRNSWMTRWPWIRKTISVAKGVLLFISVILTTAVLCMMWDMQISMHNITADGTGDNWGTGQWLAVLGFITPALAFVVSLIRDAADVFLVLWGLITWFAPAKLAW